MTARIAAFPAARGGAARAWLPALAITLGLAAIVAARFLATRAGLDPLLVGGAFGAALAALAVLGPRGGSGRLPALGRAARALPVRVDAEGMRSISVGVGVGVLLALLAVLGPAIGGATHVPGLGRPATPLLPWAAITIVVAAGEEAVLRGALFDRVRGIGGIALAVALTTVAFGLVHVPLYGWHVVPLDLAVGIVLAGLRITTGGLAAPIAAHAVADLATWWI